MQQDAIKKKTYTPPVLRMFGNIREITLGHGRNGNNDTGVGMGNDRTQP